MKTLVLDAMGVIFEVGDDVADLLCPFIAEQGGTRDLVLIQTLYREASLGVLTAAEFWKKVGIDPALEDAYLERLRLTSELEQFLSAVKSHVSAIWCLSNDVTEWSRKLRARFDLDEYLDGYVISGDIGVRKPDPAIYGRLLARARVAPAEVILADDRLANVEAARALGMVGVLFTSPAEGGAGLPSAANFDALLNLIEGYVNKGYV